MFALDPDPSPPPSPDAQCTAEAGYLGIHGNLGPQQAPSFNQTWQGPTQEPVGWCKVAPPPAVSPQNQIKMGADSLFCIVCNFFLPWSGSDQAPLRASVPHPGAASGQGVLRDGNSSTHNGV